MNLYVITGTTRGLGKSLLNQLKNKETNVIISLSSSDTAHNDNWYNYQIDLSDSYRISDLFDKIRTDVTRAGMRFNHFKKCVLINNAGTVSPIIKIKNGSDRDVIHNLHINLISPMLISKHFLSLTDNPDTIIRIIHITSGAALKPYQGWSSYCTSKAGLDHFSRVMAEEMSSEGNHAMSITFNPGIMDTGMQDSIRTSNSKHFPQRERFVQYQKNSDLVDSDLVAGILINHEEENRFENGKTYKVSDLLESSC